MNVIKNFLINFEFIKKNNNEIKKVGMSNKNLSINPDATLTVKGQVKQNMNISVVYYKKKQLFFFNNMQYI